jgi:hypothetical protein
MENSKKNRRHKSVELPLHGKAGIRGIDVTGIETKLASSGTSRSGTTAGSESKIMQVRAFIILSLFLMLICTNAIPPVYTLTIVFHPFKT